MAISAINFKQNNIGQIQRTTSKVYQSTTNNEIPYDTFENRKSNEKGTKLLNPNAIIYNLGYEKLKDKFSEEEIKQFNANRELPKGYYLRAASRNGLSFTNYKTVKDGEMPRHLELVKLSDEKAEKIKAKGKFLSNKMPEGYHLECDEKGKTYLLSEKHKDIASAMKARKKDFMYGIPTIIACFVAAVAVGCGVGELAIRFGGKVK